MKNLIVNTFLTAIVCAALSLFFGIKMNQPVLTGLGTILLGLAIGLMGFDEVIHREVVENHDEGNPSTNTGMSAVFMGFFWVIMAVVLVFGGVVILLGLQEAVYRWLAEHPGAALLAVGGDAASFGGQLLSDSQEERRSVLALLGSLPGRFVAAILVIAGVCLMAGGMLVITAPVYFDTVLEGLM